MEKVEPKPLDLEELKNPYPEDIFPEISTEEWKKIDELLREHLGFPPDRVSANIGRIVFENTKEGIKQRIKSACEFYLKYFYDPFELWNDYPELRNDKLREWIRDITENEGTVIEDCAMFRYNEWLFRLAFKDVFEEVKP